MTWHRIRPGCFTVRLATMGNTTIRNGNMDFDHDQTPAMTARPANAGEWTGNTCGRKPWLPPLRDETPE